VLRLGDLGFGDSIDIPFLSYYGQQCELSLGSRVRLSHLQWNCYGYVSSLVGWIAFPTIIAAPPPP
jgi:hypothetical protein